MPRALVVYESMFGNGRRVAVAIVAGLLDAGWEARTARVLDAPEEPDVDLLVVGAPTHALSLSRPGTRAARTSHVRTDEDARRAAAEPGADTGRGMREYLRDLVLEPGTPTAVYDTRATKGMPSGAVRSMTRRLVALGGTLLVPARRFDVVGVTGPLVEGEEEAARRWGAGLAAAFAEQATRAG